MSILGGEPVCSPNIGDHLCRARTDEWASWNDETGHIEIHHTFDTVFSASFQMGTSER